MATAIWACKTWQNSETPTLIWVGDKFEEGQKALIAASEKLGFVRAFRQQILGGIPVPIPESEAAASARIAKETAEREAAAKAKAANELRAANAVLDEAKKKAEDAASKVASLATKSAEDKPTTQKTARKVT